MLAINYFLCIIAFHFHGDSANFIAIARIAQFLYALSVIDSTKKQIIQELNTKEKRMKQG